MKLTVHVIEARNLPAMDMNGLSDPYVKLQLGRYQVKTKVIQKSLNPYWDEEFNFLVDDLKEELLISVMDEDKYFTDDFIGKINMPVSKVFEAGNKTLDAEWYQLQPLKRKTKSKDFGEICLAMCLTLENSLSELSVAPRFVFDLDKSSELKSEQHSLSSPPSRTSYSVETEEEKIVKEERLSQQKVGGRTVPIFRGKDEESNIDSSIPVNVLEKPSIENKLDDTSVNMSFGELLREMESKDQGEEMPQNLPGGILLDKAYIVSPDSLNSYLFSPDSSFLQALAERQGTTGLQQAPWVAESSGKLKREVTYTKAATKLIKAVKATEEQTYMMVDGQSYGVLASVSTPEVPYGSCFKTEILFCITPGPELPSQEESSRLVISWRSNFLQSTIMKGMIENGTRQGLKDNFTQFEELLSQNFKPVELKDLGTNKEQVLSQNFKPVELKDLGTNKEQVLASLTIEQESDWKLASHFLGNFTVFSTVFVGLYIFIHIMLSRPNILHGLEFSGLDLPDSIGEVVVCGILILQGERALKMIAKFLQARKQKGTDHGIKAHGDGWLLTVALIEGSSLAAVDSDVSSDPYVVFTCNGKTKTSSIKFQSSDPHWNEIFEFDATDDPPSVMAVDVYDFDGPFRQATVVNHAEINFVKSNLSELADVWIPLQGNLAQACQSKLHLRVFLNNTRGTEVAKEYLIKMEKEVGKKINLRSPQTNSMFQKLFGLPVEEFLINDFSCYLKRKMPLQGRLFLSPRIIGFNSSIFGHKTKFYFLWEDIEDIQVIPPSLASVGSPSLMIILRRGKGGDAKHGAKMQDSEGRLKFQFQSFVSFQNANRIIMALWKAKSLTPEQKVKIAEDESESKNLQQEEIGAFVVMEEANMSEVFSSSVGVAVNLLMELFSGGLLDRKVMEKVGCVDYNFTNWEPVKADVHQRQINYKFSKNISNYGGEVTSTQQKSKFLEKNGWLVEEVMTLQGVPYGEYFNLHIRYQVEDIPTRTNACNVQVYLGIQWLKSTKHQKRLTKSVVTNLADRLQDMLRLAEQFITGK